MVYRFPGQQELSRTKRPQTSVPQSRSLQTYELFVYLAFICSTCDRKRTGSTPHLVSFCVTSHDMSSGKSQQGMKNGALPQFLRRIPQRDIFPYGATEVITFDHVRDAQSG